ncbi:MAG: hypothetical protein HZC02_03145 [Candidatus Levybacteria bacterium]|nr:hypothetical protein [Candidatus Levybacteria bacterium]
MSNVVLVNKPKCLTPLQAINLYREKYKIPPSEKVSYAGRLDPMAQGLLLLLLGEANKKRQNFEQLTKVYTFSILFGFKTDTYDHMGKILSTNSVPENLKEKITKEVPYFLAKNTQAYPNYSSKTIAGKPLFYWARKNQLSTIKIPDHPIKIFDFVFLDIKKQTKKKFIQNIIKEIKSVKGDFRQKEIIANWQQIEAISKEHEKIHVVTFQATVSSGTYIRSLANELGERVGCGACTYMIHRTKIGEMELSNAISLL